MSTNSARRILVTGVKGQVGYEMVRSLQGLGHVVALDRQRLDVGDLAQIRSVVRELKPALIVNPAAYTAVDLAEKEADTAMRVNGEAPGVLAEEARRLGAPLIHFSTDYVFDGAKNQAYVEEDLTAPVNEYGRSKLAGERAIAASGCAYLIFRTSWVYSLRGHNFVNKMFNLAKKGAPLKIVSDQVGAPSWSVMLATMTAHIVAQGLSTGGFEASWWNARSGIYHMTGSGFTTWARFAQEIFAALPEDKRVAIEPILAAEYPTIARRPANSRLCNDKLARTFGLRAPAWEMSLRLCLAEASALVSYSLLFQPS